MIAKQMLSTNLNQHTIATSAVLYHWIFRNGPVITIDDYEFDAVCQLTYLGCTIADSFSLDAEIDKRIGKAASTVARLTARMWTSPKLSMKTKMAIYNACVMSTLLYGSETWTTYICRAGEKAQHIPPEKHPPYPGRTK